MTCAMRDEPDWARISEYVSETVGLDFPPQRWVELNRGIARAADKLGFADVRSFSAWLLSQPPARAPVHALASELTIGETYFFRDSRTLAALTDHILPGIIGARRGLDHRIHLWSAGCSTGEEAYSLAILLVEHFPELRDWRVTISATDVNPTALQKARVARYGEWSFRGMPRALKDRYFRRDGDGSLVLDPRISGLVEFSCLNLVGNGCDVAARAGPVDVVLCRNVLMYMRRSQMRRAMAVLRGALGAGGWLAVSACEASKSLFSGFAEVNFPGAIWFRKRGTAGHGSAFAASPAMVAFPADAPPFLSPPPPPAPQAQPAEPLDEAPAMKVEVETQAEPDRLAGLEAMYGERRYGEVADRLLDMARMEALSARAHSLLARALAHQGRLSDALGWCERWIALDKLDPMSHFVRGTILLERGKFAEARYSLHRAIYLDPELILAHLVLGNAASACGKAEEGRRHLRNALRLLHRQQPDSVLPESDDMTAGHLIDMITSATAAGTAP